MDVHAPLSLLAARYSSREAALRDVDAVWSSRRSSREPTAAPSSRCRGATSRRSSATTPHGRSPSWSSSAPDGGGPPRETGVRRAVLRAPDLDRGGRAGRDHVRRDGG